MNQHYIIFFVLVPMAAGILCLFAYRWRQVQRVIGLLALGLDLALGVWALSTIAGGTSVLVSQMGNWPAPFGITIAVDALSALMLTMAAVVCLGVYIYSMGQFDDNHEGAFFHPLFHLLLFGVQWSFVTGDLFNLFVAFEIMLMASYAIFCIGTSTAQIRQAYKYVLLNLFGSTLFVTCAGLLYGQLGTLNMADLTRLALAGELTPGSYPVIVMLLLVFGGKTAIFPLWYWLPDTYHTLPAALGGLFAGLLTKVGAYVMLRVFVMMFGADPHAANLLAPIILLSAGVTMFLGVLGAVSRHSVRGILAIHIISQVGYMLMGIGLAIAAGVVLENRILAAAGATFFIMHNMVVKCCLFLCGGLMQEHAGSDDLEKIGGLLRRAPWLATLFLIAALSLAGLPPLSGFFGKWALVVGGVRSGHYVVTAFAIMTSILTLLSMLKIWSYGFWSPAQGVHVQRPFRKARVAGGMMGIGLLVVAALSMGLGAESYFKLCLKAGQTLVQRTDYVTAVLGARGLRGAPTETAEIPAEQRLAQAAQVEH